MFGDRLWGSVQWDTSLCAPALTLMPRLPISCLARHFVIVTIAPCAADVTLRHSGKSCRAPACDDTAHILNPVLTLVQA